MEVAKQKGWFKEAGLDVEMVWFEYAPSIDAFSAGKIDADMIVAGDDMVTGASGAKSKIVCLIDYSEGSDMIIGVPGIESIKDLKGKKIGITRLGSASDVAARVAFEHLGVSPKEVTLISMGGIPDILAGLKAGVVNGGILSPPSSTIARDLGFRPLVFIPDLGKDFTFAGIAAKRSYVQANPEIARAFMAALTEGARAYKSDAKAALRVLKKYARADDRMLEAGYKEYTGAITSPPYPSLKGLEALRESLADASPALKSADLKKFVDDQFVRPNR